MQATEIRVPVPWGYIAAKSWGNPEGYPILAVHGTMDNAASFDNLAPLLPRTFNFIAVDLPGHGKSSHYPDGLPYHFMEMVFSLKRFVDHFKWVSFYFIGHSFGGMIGSLFAAMYPELVKKLVMLDIVKPKTYPMEYHTDIFRTNYTKLFDIESKMNGKVIPMYTKDVLLDKLINSRVTGIKTESAESLSSRVIRSDGTNADRFYLGMDQKLKASIHVPLSIRQLCDILSGIRCELLMIQAKESSGTFVLDGALEVLDVFRKSCSRFKLVVVDGKHDVHLDNPKVMAPVLSKFLLGSSSL